MSEQSVVGIYTRMETVEEAVRALDKGGFPTKKVSIVAQNMENEQKVHGFITAGDSANTDTGTGTGAWFGGIFGLLCGAALIWVPAVGPMLIAGPLAVALASGVGGLLGALTGWGISKKNITAYQAHLKGGKYLLIASGSSIEVALAHTILGDTGSEGLTVHSDSAE